MSLSVPQELGIDEARPVTARPGRVAVGMGIPIGPTCGWEWEKYLAYGNSHMWES